MSVVPFDCAVAPRLEAGDEIQMSLSNNPDQVTWAPEPSGKFSVPFLYRKILQLSDRSVPKFVWSVGFPRKIKISIGN